MTMTKTTVDRIDTSPAVDVHAHLWIPEVQNLVMGSAGFADQRVLDLRRSGPESERVTGEMIQRRLAHLTSIERRIDQMDRNGIAAQVVSVVPTQYHSWADRGLAEDVALATNAGIAEHCALAPARLSGFGVAPLQHPQIAVSALEDAVLRHGLRGVEVPTYVPAADGSPMDLSNRELDVFWSRAQELGAAVFIHPWGCTLDERLDRWYLSNSVGQPVEHTVALSHLIVGGVLDRHPELVLVAAHGGGYLPSLMPRIDHAWINRTDARGCVDQPSSYLTRLYFDSLVYTADALNALIRTVGHQQVLLGSDYPFDMGVEDPLMALTVAEPGREVFRAIASENAERLGLTPPMRPTTALMSAWPGA